MVLGKRYENTLIRQRTQSFYQRESSMSPSESSIELVGYINSKCQRSYNNIHFEETQHAFGLVIRF